MYFKLQSFVFMPVFGLGNGMVAIIGYNYGARLRNRIYDGVKVSLTYAAVIMAMRYHSVLGVPGIPDGAV